MKEKKDADANNSDYQDKSGFEDEYIITNYSLPKALISQHSTKAATKTASYTSPNNLHRSKSPQQAASPQQKQQPVDVNRLNNNSQFACGRNNNENEQFHYERKDVNSNKMTGL